MADNLRDRYTVDEHTITLDRVDSEIPLYSPVCNYCKNYKEYRKCKAFDLIPLEIWVGKNPHTDAVEGDKGILFEDTRK